MNTSKIVIVKILGLNGILGEIKEIFSAVFMPVDLCNSTIYVTHRVSNNILNPTIVIDSFMWILSYFILFSISIYEICLSVVNSLLIWFCRSLTFERMQNQNITMIKK